MGRSTSRLPQDCWAATAKGKEARCRCCSRAPPGARFLRRLVEETVAAGLPLLGLALKRLGKAQARGCQQG